MEKTWFLTFIGLCACLQQSSCYSTYIHALTKLSFDLLTRRSFLKEVIPRSNSTSPVQVHISSELIHIHSVDADRGEVTLTLHLDYEWKNIRTTWDPLEYNNIYQTKLDPNVVWTPDIIIWNLIEPVREIHRGKLVVMSSGTTHWWRTQQVTVSCHITPGISTHQCDLPFYSLSYDGLSIDPHIRSFIVSKMFFSNQWEVVNMITNRSVIYYPCCPEPFPEVRYRIEFERKPTQLATPKTLNFHEHPSLVNGLGTRRTSSVLFVCFVFILRTTGY